MNDFFKPIFSVVAVIIALVALTTSCTPPVYIPNVSNVPVLTKKGDGNVAYAFGANGHDLQGSFAITDDIGVMLNTSLGIENNESGDSEHHHAYIETGLGYTALINQSAYKSSDDLAFIFNTFAGAGTGVSSGRIGYNAAEGTMYKAFVQPGIGLYHKNIDVFLACKLNYVNFYDYTESYNGTIEEVYLPTDNFYYEPTLTWRVGSEKVKFFQQTGLSFPNDPDIAYRHRPIIFSFGLQYHFGNKGYGTRANPANPADVPATTF